MSFKLRARYQYTQLLQFVETMALPSWIFSARAKMLVLVLGVTLSVAYVVQINNLATSGYLINTLEDRLSEVNNQTQKLATEVATYQSMASIESRLGTLSMVDAPKVTFVKTGHDTVVAAR